jgi:biotin carboxyl carrier protein
MRPAVIVCCVFVLLTSCRDKDDADEAQKRSNQPSAAKQVEGAAEGAKEQGVTLDEAAQARAGLKIESLKPIPVRPRLTAFGKLEQNPSASFVVRAPLAGTLHAAPDRNWPSLGETLSAGAVFGQLEPRLLPADRLNIATQLSTARSDLSSSVAALSAAQSAYDRAKALNVDNKNVSDKAVQEAEARLATEQAKVRAAQSNIGFLEASIEPGRTGGSRQLTAERGGEVVEVLAQPGEAVEQGAVILQLSRFDHLLARIDLPIGEHIPVSSRSAFIIPAGFEDQKPLVAERVAVATSSDAHTQGISFLYRLEKTVFGLRPGTAVTAELSTPGPTREGVLIPRSAVAQEGGKSWAYVQVNNERFARRFVPQNLPIPAGYVAVTGFSPGDRVVVTGAQSLLSEEFKSENETDEP